MKPSTWCQWWNGLFHNRPPEDDCVEWMLDFLGFFPVLASLYAFFLLAVALYLWSLDRKWKRDDARMKKEWEVHS
ncbi:hypothetical protein FJZ27_01000 [Candidatus Peribacteria bacterium]|nr:hypothetical protein [Candidatus Peribacteria bacterium]